MFIGLSKYKGSAALTILITFFSQLVLSEPTYALSEGPSQPEAMQFEPVDATDIVNLSTGDFVYNLPLFEVPGPEGGFPINISYHAEIGLNQEPTWVGLGWALNPGAINRVINGYPDDYKGAKIETEYESETVRGGGVGLNISYGPPGVGMGVGFGYDSQKGFGVNSISVSVEIPGANVGLSFSVGKGGYSVGASYMHGAGPSAARLGVSAGSQGFNLNGGISDSRFSSRLNLLGFSLNSQGGGASFSVASTGFSSQSQMSGEGSLTSRSISIPIPLPKGFFITLSYYDWKWKLHEKYFEYSYGYLYQEEYHQSTHYRKKYERHTRSNALFASQDNYSVNSHGISGGFKPFTRQSFVLYDESKNEKKGKLKREESGFGPYNGNNNVYFRFLNDPGLNYTTYIHPMDEHFFSDFYGRQNSLRHSSKQITPIYRTETGKLIGFKIHDIDGKMYEFMKPVYNRFMYSYSKNDRDTFIETKTSMATPYAVNWLITAIKGPDYVDRGNLDELDGDDWGYWVKFTYEAQENFQLWRSPYENFSEGTHDTDTESFSTGLRDVIFLEEIETPTHIAKFVKSKSKNRNFPTQATAVKLSSLRFTHNGSYATHYIDGDWTHQLDSLTTNPTILHVNAFYSTDWGYSCGDEDEDEDGRGEYEYISHSLKKSQISYTYEAATDRTKIIEHVTPNDATDQCGNPASMDDITAMFYVGNVLNTNQQLAKQLDRIDLYEKNNLSVKIKSVGFEYDWSLCEDTPNSKAANGGKMALKKIQFYGENLSKAMPPYEFEYANGAPAGTGLNPDYSTNKWDRWSVYKLEGSRHRHLAEQSTETVGGVAKKDYGAAWSLTQIKTPTGGSIEIEYESDDYYWVDEVIDFSHALTQPLYYKSSRNTIVVNDKILNNLYEGAPIYIQEKVEYTSCYYVNPCIGCFTEISYNIQRLEVESINYVTNAVTFTNAYHFSDNYGGCDDGYIYTYTLFVSPRKVAGGGIRVKSITSNTHNSSYKTNYTYTNENGISTGTTASLPPQYRNVHYGFGQEAKGKPANMYRRACMDEELSYGRPSPGVLYSAVTVENVNLSGIGTNGKTVYEFYTGNDHKVEASLEANQLSLVNYTGSHGKPKAVSYYDNDGNILKKDEFIYHFSSELGKRNETVGKVMKADGTEFSELDTKPLGIIEEKYGYKNESGTNQFTSVKNRLENVYLTSTVSTQYDPAEADKKNISYTRNFAWDQLTGRAICTAVQRSDGKAAVSKNIPAYWDDYFPAMKDKNMLTQSAQSFSYVTQNEVDISNADNIKNYAFPPSDIATSEVTTWSNQWETEGNIYNVWRQNDKYAYNKQVDLAGGSGFNDFNDWTTSVKKPYPDVTRLNPWKMISNITMYDRHSHPIEEINPDGSYTSSLYRYGNARPTAIIQNAKQGEFGYISFEDGWEDWERGSRIIQTNSDNHTGENRVYCSYNYGPSKNFFVIDGIDKHKSYVLEGWIKRLWGAAKIAIEPKTASHSSAGNNKTAAITSGNGWQLIKVEISPADMVNLPANGYLRVWCGFANGQGYVDDIRFYPKDAFMNTYTYDPVTWKLTSSTDENNITTYFEYDEAGRLIKIKDQNRKIISTHAYKYGSEQ
jgi:YD repeat-containing protein